MRRDLHLSLPQSKKISLTVTCLCSHLLSVKEMPGLSRVCRLHRWWGNEELIFV